MAGFFIRPLVPKLGTRYLMAVQVIAKRTLVQFWTRHARAEGPLKAWFSMASQARWAGPADIKAEFGTNVDFLADNRVVFDVAGNRYRLVVHIAYKYNRVLIKFVGTHAEYDKIDAEIV